MRSTHELLHTRPTEALRGLKKSDKRTLITNRNIAVNARTLDADIRGSFSEAAGNLGFTSFELHTIFVAMASFLNEQRIVLPEGKKQKKQRNEIIDSLLAGARISIDGDCKVAVSFAYADVSNDAFMPINTLETEELANKLATDPGILGRVVSFVKPFLSSKTAYLYCNSVPQI